MSMAKSTATPLISRGLPAVVVGVVSLVWPGVTVGHSPSRAPSGPGVTALVLTVCVVAWALVTGVMEVALSFRHGESAGERAMWLLSGLVSVLLGIVLAARPRVCAVTLVSVFGVFGTLHGAFVLVVSAGIHRATYATGRLARSH